MRITFMIHIWGLALVCLGMTMVLPLGISWYYQDGTGAGFVWSGMLTLGAGGVLVLLPHTTYPLERREGLVTVSVLWCLVTVFGSFPFLFSGATSTFTDAFFESMSGFTTTGATVLTRIDGQPQAILFWRSWIQWVGGMGIIALVLAIFPLFGVGVLQFSRGQDPGPALDRLVPKIGQTVQLLWSVYVLLSGCELLLLWAGGMSWYEAALQAMTTMATGGFSPHGFSIGAYKSVYIEGVIIVFMLLAGTNFSLHFFALRSRFRVYWRDPEWRFYLGVVAVTTAGLTMFLLWRTEYGLAEALRYTLFQVVSIVTTTGFTTTDFARWPVLSQYTLFLLMFVGGCAGSTGGAIKHMRLILLLKHAYWQLYRLLHPRAVLQLRLGQQHVSEEVLLNVQAFFVLYMLSFIVAVLYLTSVGIDITTALSAAASALGNVGPGLGGVGPTDTYAWMPVSAKWLLAACMLLGRLELSTLLVLCIPHLWKQ